MKQKSIFPKVAVDLFFVQLTWSVWFIGFVLLAHIVMITVSLNTGSALGDYLLFSHSSAKIYMLVIGIISAYAFLTFYVNHGVTRKDYFRGSALAAVGVAIAISLIATLLSGLEYMIIEMTNLPVTLDRSLADGSIESSDNSISIVLPKEIISSSILVHSSSWFVSMLMYSLNILSLYVIGWLIGAGYYRFGWVIGFGFIAIALVSIVIGDLLWGTELGEPLSNWLPFDSISLSLWGSVAGSIVLIGIILSFIRIITRRVTIKM
ncbi:hypothetical protein CIL05_18015 [Virgibacillus profundi]|uniref:Uncharacterized protein n=1 Tax=Virgibacillus profundi TaxID=2024555 RepID=A0A2A2IB22_9BACI|nr:hypothetical protein [Virgibacillus profundi]PAV28263.1 hypothetical protein CIL05_18015 [Virgibacillus profundi]PXY52567.1 hypothetical protein CIT14_17455 [Virgibacillus profundi]